MKKLLAGVLVSLCATTAHAEFETGNTLLSKLQASNNNPVERGFGIGFVVGVYDALVHIKFCPGNEAGITVGQVVDITREYLLVNAPQRHKSAEVLIADALKRVWPCKQSNRPSFGT